MDNESLIQFSENGGISHVSTPPLDALDEQVMTEAKITAMIFGVLLVVVLPIGAIISEHGALSVKEKYPVASTVEHSGRSTLQPMAYTGNSVIETAPLNQAAGVSNTAAPFLPGAAKPAAQLTLEEKYALSDLVRRVSASVQGDAARCHRGGGVVRSGFGGEPLCSGGSFFASWPIVSVCGTSPSDTKWTVFNGSADTWDITITCANRPECDGPSNALCTNDGCTFSKECLPE